MPPKEAPKRRNWTADEDLMLLRQLNLERPFLTEQSLGPALPRWEAVVKILNECEDFDRDVDVKRLQGRFQLLQEKHRKANAESMTLSGVDEDESETTKLLDEIVELVDGSMRAARLDLGAIGKGKDIDRWGAVAVHHISIEL
ncbi:hypothetical protein SDRG_12223 [Saprolegnia diclina VS20]|uniref:Myb-like domain-containing protein n=1 Tax=Saprolegnia diclina (strain VS20) TaxID=1156394 RepID=T0Q2C2_SAPDV|nr:hypothetical protein SDRG_12223 [Saprolegnia diclina VS20]XP_008618945.1 hypothetical protein SDRG_14585 [Saprolegnia diclina VS20]EQC27525.1 hypothetical protein SDRG_14585 [Saprolegnia diclina VS20]EQC29941.1 hypothetical protein SDRG_12223 [Saprolegnia diclina VS20]|eukprot:XP_008616508.1 hypothetical protein SDRG_12223 [Saprolegnia diclina VS20]